MPSLKYHHFFSACQVLVLASLLLRCGKDAKQVPATSQRDAELQQSQGDAGALKFGQIQTIIKRDVLASIGTKTNRPVIELTLESVDEPKRAPQILHREWQSQDMIIKIKDLTPGNYHLSGKVTLSQTVRLLGDTLVVVKADTISAKSIQFRVANSPATGSDPTTANDLIITDDPAGRELPVDNQPPATPTVAPVAAATPTPTVMPQALLRLAPQDYFQFGTIALGQRKDSYDFNLTNTGTGTATNLGFTMISENSGTAAMPFSVAGPCTAPALELAPGESCRVHFSIVPQRLGNVAAVARLEYFDELATKSLDMQLFGFGKPQ